MLTRCIVQEKSKDQKIEIFVQEPRFTDLDIAFFKSMNITVLETPAAEAEVGEETFFFAPCLEWRSEIPYLQRGVQAPLYITSSAEWIYDEAERFKKQASADTPSNLVDECDAAMEAAKEFRASHYETRFHEDVQAADSLNFSYYTFKPAQELEEQDEEDLAAKLDSLKV